MSDDDWTISPYCQVHLYLCKALCRPRSWAHDPPWSQSLRTPEAIRPKPEPVTESDQVREPAPTSVPVGILVEIHGMEWSPAHIPTEEGLLFPFQKPPRSSVFKASHQSWTTVNIGLSIEACFCHGKKMNKVIVTLQLAILTFFSGFWDIYSQLQLSFLFLWHGRIHQTPSLAQEEEV